MMLPGAQTVTVRNVSSGTTRDRLNAPIKVITSTTVRGCAMQPMSVAETVSLTDVETEMWRCLLPPVPAALAVTTASEILYQSMIFQVMGAKPQVDLMGNTDHVNLELQKQIA